MRHFAIYDLIHQYLILIYSLFGDLIEVANWIDNKDSDALHQAFKNNECALRCGRLILQKLFEKFEFLIKMKSEYPDIDISLNDWKDIESKYQDFFGIDQFRFVSKVYSHIMHEQKQSLSVTCKIKTLCLLDINFVALIPTLFECVALANGGLAFNSLAFDVLKTQKEHDFGGGFNGGKPNFKHIVHDSYIGSSLTEDALKRSVRGDGYRFRMYFILEDLFLKHFDTIPNSFFQTNSFSGPFRRLSMYNQFLLKEHATPFPAQMYISLTQTQCEMDNLQIWKILMKYIKILDVHDMITILEISGFRFLNIILRELERRKNGIQIRKTNSSTLSQLPNPKSIKPFRT